MSNLIPFDFESHQIRVILDDDGCPLFVAKDVADTLSYKDPTSAIKAHCRGVQEYHPIPDNLGRKQRTRVIREPDLYRLVANSSLPSAVRFERKVFEEILPAIRRTGSYAVPGLASTPGLDAKLKVCQVAAAMLRMSETSKIQMLADAANSEGVDASFLPSYVDEDLVRSLTALLKEHDAKLSAKAVNLAMLDLGFLEELERQSSKGGTKRFKSLTETGLRFGRNETSPQNPRETQPLYYASRFAELLDIVIAHLAQEDAA